MLLAAVDDNTYNVFLYLHILSFLVAFAPAIINPLLEAYFKKNGGDAALTNWAGFTVTYTRVFSLGALAVLLVTGMAMIGLSDDFWQFSDGWISFAFLIWIAIGGVVSAMILKGEKQVAAGDTSAAPLIARGGQIATVLMVVMLYLMIFKPGA